LNPVVLNWRKIVTSATGLRNGRRQAAAGKMKAARSTYYCAILIKYFLYNEYGSVKAAARLVFLISFLQQR
jgi:hypothetical protein